MFVAAPPLSRSGLLAEVQPADGAVRLVQLHVWLLFLIPATLRFEPLGAAGNPAALFAVGLFVLWSIATLAPSLAARRACPPVRIVLAAFWLAVLLSYAAMHRFAVATDIGLGSDIFIVTLLAFSGVALFAAEGIRTRDELGRVVRTLVAAAATMSFIAIVQSRFQFDPTRYLAEIPGLSTYRDSAAILARGGLARPAGTASHPIEFGVVVGLALAPAIYVALYDRVWRRPARWSAVALIGLGIPVSVSRSAVLVALCVLGAFLIGTTNTVRTRSLPILLGFLATVFVAFPGLLGQFRSLFTAGAGDPSIATRISDYTFVSTAVESAPWLGSGPGSLPTRIRILDNQYLMTLVELGSIGLFALVALLSTIPVLAILARRRLVDEGDRFLGLMLAGMGVGVIVATFTFDALSFAMFTAVIALLLGLTGRWWLIVWADGRRPPHKGGVPEQACNARRSGSRAVARIWPPARLPAVGGNATGTGLRSTRAAIPTRETKRHPPRRGRPRQ